MESQLRVEQDATIPYTVLHVHVWARDSSAESLSDAPTSFHTLCSGPWDGDTGLISLSAYKKFLHDLERSPFLLLFLNSSWIQQRQTVFFHHLSCMATSPKAFRCELSIQWKVKCPTRTKHPKSVLSTALMLIQRAAYEHQQSCQFTLHMYHTA